MVVYLAIQNAEIEVEKLTHFALGLFWKASVHSWRGDTTYPRIDLGPYSEEIRKWLRGQNAFPKYVYLIVVIEKPQKAQITMNDPYEGVRQEWRTHFVHVPGVLFMMALGENRGRLGAFPLHNECRESDQRIRRSYGGFRKANG